MGIIHKQNASDWTDLPSTALRNRHTTYNDRIFFTHIWLYYTYWT